MPTKLTIPYTSGMFFITFTCYNWLPLIDKVKGYDIIYNWFNHLIVNGHYINGYVIMPNHVHAVISFEKTNQFISTIIRLRSWHTKAKNNKSVLSLCLGSWHR
jgi:REP element-mobilizing transposase RayT